MQRRPEFAGVCLALLSLGLTVVATSGCKVYKKDLLEQTKAPDAGGIVAPDAAADGGGRDGASGAPDTGRPLTRFDPNDCLWGDCWWSTGSGDQCRSAGLPRPSDRPAGGD